VAGNASRRGIPEIRAHCLKLQLRAGPNLSNALSKGHYLTTRLSREMENRQ